MVLAITKNRWQRSQRREILGKKEIWLEREQRWQEVVLDKWEVSPCYGDITVDSPWEGSCEKKPWDYDVTVAIPCLNTPETLPVCIELLRLQNIKPYFLIIDTGSIADNLSQVDALRSPDVEVHHIRTNGVMHPSDYPAMAMDLAFTLCRTEYLFATHVDCFVRRRDLLADLIHLCKTVSPVVGYELSPRQHEDWKGMVSHTCSMYHIPTMDKIGFGWSLRRLCNVCGIVDYKPDPMRPNWPDTEILGNYILREAGIKPHLLAGEENCNRTLDDNIDHFRSYTAGKHYSPEYFRTVSAWFDDAMTQGKARIAEWKSIDVNSDSVI